MKRWLIGALAVLLVAGLAANLSVGAEQADYRVFIVRPPINNLGIRANEPLPAVCQPGRELQVMACRGEYEPASFVVETDRTLEDVRVAVSPLQSTSGTIPAGSVDVRVVQPMEDKLNWVLVHDPGLLATVDDKMVFTREPVDTETLQPADIAARRQFWLTVHVPENTPAGVYAGSVTVIPGNAPSREIRLELTVPNFDLLAPNFQYSIYYARKTLSDEMHLNELRNMVAHGCTNPNIYGSGISADEDGKLDFSAFGKLLSLREQAGMPKSGPLYLVGGGPVNSSPILGPEDRERNVRWVREIVTWARQRGYSDVYFMGTDEAYGEALTNQREAWESVHEGGGRMFVANYAGLEVGWQPDSDYCGFFPSMADVLDLPVILHPDHLKDTGLERILSEKYRKIIQGVHDNGFKIYTYMDEIAGKRVPERHRRMRGIGLWKADLDGTMTWSYDHYYTDPHVEPGPLHWASGASFVLRGKGAPLDTLSWEAYREGYDDARYLATLQDAVSRAKTAGKSAELVAETEAWLAGVPPDVDLDAWRRKMASYAESLLEQ